MPDGSSFETCPFCPRPLRVGGETCGLKSCTRRMCHRKVMHRAGKLQLHETRRKCDICLAAFTPVADNQITCGAKPCQLRRAARKRQQRKVVVAPTQLELPQVPEKSLDSWSLPAPAFGTHLPGGGLEIFISGLKCPLTLERTHALHGLLTNLLSTGHGQAPEFTMVPYGHGWGVYIPDEVNVALLAGRIFVGRRLFEDHVTIRFGYPIRLKAPPVSTVGPRRVVVDTITPVIIRSAGSTVARTVPDEPALQATLIQNLAKRLKLDVEAFPLRIITGCTLPSRSIPGGKLGQVAGWEGQVVVLTNATGEFLLRCAGAVLGLGGRTAFGYGRVRVSEYQERDGVCAGPWFVTPHAEQRFREITKASGTHHEVLASIIQACETAKFVKRCDSNVLLFKGPAPARLRFLVEDEATLGGKPVLRTILPSWDGHPVLKRRREQRQRY